MTYGKCQQNLGSVDISTEPNKGGREPDEVQVVSSNFFEAREHSAKLFEFTNEALDQVTFPREMKVILTRVFPIRPGGNNGDQALRCQKVYAFIRIIGLIQETILGLSPGTQGFGWGDISDRTTGAPEGQAMAQALRHQVDFAAEAATRAA